MRLTQPLNVVGKIRKRSARGVVRRPADAARARTRVRRVAVSQIRKSWCAPTGPDLRLPGEMMPANARKPLHTQADLARPDGSRLIDLISAEFQKSEVIVAVVQVSVRAKLRAGARSYDVLSSKSTRARGLRVERGSLPSRPTSSTISASTARGCGEYHDPSFAGIYGETRRFPRASRARSRGTFPLLPGGPCHFLRCRTLGSGGGILGRRCALRCAAATGPLVSGTGASRTASSEREEQTAVRR